MAYLNATLLNDLQVSGAINEKYFPPKGVINAVKKSNEALDYIAPSTRQALATTSSLRGVKLPAIKDQTVVVNTTPGFQNIPSNLAESAEYGFTFYDVFSGFRYYPAAHANNSVDGEFFVQETMKNVLDKMATSVEGILTSVLDSRKTQALSYATQASQGDGTFTFNTTPDELEISKAAQKENMFFYLNNLAQANDIAGNYQLVTSRGGTITQRAELAKYGASNDKNLQAMAQMGMDRLHESSNISPSSDVFKGYFFRDGAIGMLENYPFDFRNGTVVGGRKWSISDMELPFVNMRANIYTNTEATDATSLITSGNDSNLYMTSFEEMAIWVRFCVPYRYNSDLTTRVSDIIKVAGKTS